LILSEEDASEQRMQTKETAAQNNAQTLVLGLRISEYLLPPFFFSFDAGNLPKTRKRPSCRGYFLDSQERHTHLLTSQFGLEFCTQILPRLFKNSTYKRADYCGGQLI